MGKKKLILHILVMAVLVTGSIVPFWASVSPAAAETADPYLVETFVDDDGNEIGMFVVPGKPPDIVTTAEAEPEPISEAGVVTISDVPAFYWSYGCSATSAAMLFGYYDRTGYDDMYTGDTNGGVCPLDNSGWGTTDYDNTCGYGAVTCGECPLSATHNGVDGRTTDGHVDDYWIAYGCEGPDPWEGGTEHTQGDCTGDYMGTNQWKYGDTTIEYNSDGETVFFYDLDGYAVYDFDDYEPDYRDGCHGMRLFAESRGYTVTSNYNQLIYGYDGNTEGFTFADYMAEIDAGRPVLIHVSGHTMLGYGYDSDSNLVYLHDTWDYDSGHTMTWGGTYSGLQHYGVTVLRLAELIPSNEVWVDDDYSESGYNDGHTWGFDAFASIQDGINGINAVGGGTVHVAAGTYYENITLVDGVEVLGAGADVTTIDGGASGPVVTADTITSTVTLDGFTIQNGSGYESGGYGYGGGVYIVSTSSSLTVSNCTFSGNSVSYNGGGMYNENSSPTVTGCLFSGNSASRYGGGIYNENSSPAVTDCTFTDNSSDNGGGGMYNDHSSPTVTGCAFESNETKHGGGMHNYSYSSPTVTGCTFENNSSFSDGSGMYNNFYSSPIVTDCTFDSNTAGSDGGGMFNIAESSPTVTNCTFTGNSADGYGGGMYVNHDSSPTVSSCTFSGNSADDGGGICTLGGYSSPTLTNCTFTGNTAGDDGGGMHNRDSSPTLTNCTFAGNTAIDDGNGIYNFLDSSPTVTNCILWDGGDEIYNEDTSAPVVTYCDVQGSYSGTGNINADPLFVDAGTGNYHLQLGSPCVDTGDNSAPSIPATDFEGDTRIMDGDDNGTATVDMGADECYGPSTFGLLRVQTSPAVPTTISIDGIPRSAWGLDWVKVYPGEYTLSFTDVFAYLAPTEIEVTYEGEDPITQPVTDPITVYADETTTVTVHFVPLGNLWVSTDPMVATIISVDGEPPSNNWGFWVDLLPGDYSLSVSDVVGYGTPVEVEVTYPGQSAVTQSITDPITVEAGGTTAVVISFIRLGNLKVDTSPNLEATIFVDGEPMNAWGFWVDLEEGEYTVSFEELDGYLTPPPTVVTVTAGVTTYITGDYENGEIIVN